MNNGYKRDFFRLFLKVGVLNTCTECSRDGVKVTLVFSGGFRSGLGSGTRSLVSGYRITSGLVGSTDP